MGKRGVLSARAVTLIVLLFLLFTILQLTGCSCDFEDFGASSTTSEPTSAASSTSSTASSTTSSTEAALIQQEGEIFLEPAGTSGPESFTGETFVPVGPTSTLSIPTSTTTTQTLSTTTVPGGPIQLASYSGDTPALYGGSRSKALVDKEGQLRFFEQNPEKAAAFCLALNSDPTFRWSGGTQIRPDQLRDYFAELTPMMLTRDTRVTNYGYRNGRPTPRQSVLQAGQMVLVDRYGVPRVRCECGNPLTPPKPVRTAPRYTGPRWRDFDPTVIIVIQQTTVVINTFVLIDIYTGQTFDRPAGTDGVQDAAHNVTKYRLDTEMTRNDANDERVNTIKWTAEITVNPDGTLSGTGKGTFHSDGTTWEGTTKTGSFTVDASFDVNIAGTVDTTELGPILKVKPTLGGYAVDNVTINTTGSETDVRASLDRHIPEFMKDSFTELDLKSDAQGPLYATVVAGGYEGNATLTAVE